MTNATKHPTETREYWLRCAAAERRWAQDERGRRTAPVESIQIHLRNAEEYEARAAAIPEGTPALNEVLDVGLWDNDGRVVGNHFCRRCAGTGQFITRVENGQPKGPGGICFRCQGKGHHTQADRRRNWGRDQHVSFA